jgi:hypothetical protein
MSSTRWRNLCFVFAAISFVQLWRDCHREPAEAPAVDCPTVEPAARRSPAFASDDDRADPHRDSRSPTDTPAKGFSFYGFTAPAWAVWLAPHPGESLHDYRDRVLPLAQSAIAPQRARVARSRDDFAALANLNPRQRAELDAATTETASALEERVMGAVMNGEVTPSTFKPMAGVGIAKDLLDIVGHGNQRFVDSLDDGQRAKLAQHPFDFGDYLVFSTPWENALKILD